MLARFVGDLREAAPLFGAIEPARFADFLETLLAGVPFRPAHGGHPRLAILGTLEARLVSADRVVLGGLVEGVWPGEVRDDPWLSRPMRERVGLSPPERQIGLAAHDFAQALAGPEVILTRARKIDGTPTLPARWLSRLEALLGADARWQATLAHDAVAWDREIAGAGEAGRTLVPPHPTPPVEARPSKLYVTSVEKWLRDPYWIYARYCLGLEPLKPIDADVDALERGNLFHAALETFANGFPGTLPRDAEMHLVEIGRKLFAPYMARPAVAAFWWPRFVGGRELVRRQRAPPPWSRHLPVRRREKRAARSGRLHAESARRPDRPRCARPARHPSITRPESRRRSGRSSPAFPRSSR